MILFLVLGVIRCGAMNIGCFDEDFLEPWV